MAVKFYRKVIHVSYADSPNVRYAEAEKAAGLRPSGRILVPGVLPYDELQKRLATWDRVRICIGIHGQFWDGPEDLLYPPLWLNAASQRDRVAWCRSQPVEAIGVDPAEGGDRTAMAAVNRWGLKELVSRKTPDTSDITGEAIAFIRKHGVSSNKVAFDRGGGGKQHADRLRLQEEFEGVRTVAFGESLTLDPKRGIRLIEEKIRMREEHYTYVNRRAEMYWQLRDLLDPGNQQSLSNGHEHYFAIPQDDDIYQELRRQMAPIPVKYDPEGRRKMLPKNKRSPESKEPCLVELIGHSPDELDALVLSVHAMLHEVHQATAGAI